MKFWKMNGAGNDFLVLNNIEENIPREKFPLIARTLCHRHLSIGADGFMVVERAEGEADYRMLFYNSDGSMGEMCGNGARCICRYGYENGLAKERQVVETTAGVVIGYRIDERKYKIRLNDPSIIREAPVEVGGNVYDCHYVELGNPGIPHAVVPIENLKEFPENELFELGSAIRHHKAFPKGANVNFYEIMEKDFIYERTFERGVEDFTFACGTGTGSMVSVLTLAGKVSGRNVKVEVPGGLLIIDIDRGEKGEILNIFLTGPTNIVAKGEVTDEELHL